MHHVVEQPICNARINQSLALAAESARSPWNSDSDSDSGSKVISSLSPSPAVGVPYTGSNEGEETSKEAKERLQSFNLES